MRARRQQQKQLTACLRIASCTAMITVYASDAGHDLGHKLSMDSFLVLFDELLCSFILPVCVLYSMAVGVGPVIDAQGRFDLVLKQPHTSSDSLTDAFVSNPYSPIPHTADACNMPPHELQPVPCIVT